MPSTAFSTWAELLAHLLTLYRNARFDKAAASIGNGLSVRWASAAELRAAIDHARDMAALESGAVRLRVHLRDGGRG